MIEKDRKASQVHSDEVDNIIEKFGLYTSLKNMPASLICEHKNQVGTFKRNFIAGHTLSKVGYVSEDDKRVNKIKFRDLKGAKEESVDSDKNVKSDHRPHRRRQDLREIIERHAYFKKKQRWQETELQYSPAKSAKIQRAQAIFQTEVKDKRYDQISLKHNKPLPGMLSQTQQTIMERKAQEKKQRQISEEIKNRDYNFQLKNLSAKHMAKEFMSAISATTPTQGLKGFDESTQRSIMSTVSAINKKFEPISWNRKKVPSARIMKRKMIVKSLIVKYLG